MFRVRNWKIGRSQAAQRSRARVTIVDPKGVALADSHHDPETMENHATRPEIMAAYRNGVGSSTRHSATINQDLCYLALRLTYHGEPGYILRLAVPLDDVDSSIAAVRWRILWASIYAALGGADFRLLLLAVFHPAHRAAARLCGRIGGRALLPGAAAECR